VLAIPKSARLDGDNEIHHDTTTFSGHNMPIILPFLVLLVFAICAGLVFAQVSQLEHYNALYSYLNEWVFFSRGRNASAIEAATAALLLIAGSTNFTKTGLGATYIDNHSMLKLARKSLVRLVDANRRLLESNDEGYLSTIGFSEELDSLTLKPQCETDPSIATFHEMYRCSSALQLTQFVLTAVQTVIVNPSEFSNGLNGLN
jgi:hypothetical protein